MQQSADKEAKNLFFEYDGSQFYMSRGGVDAQYKRYQISKSVEAEWLKELTEIKVKELDSRGNWKVVYFLNNNGDYQYLDSVLRASPRGVFWEKCAFLETLLQYLENCPKKSRLTPARISAALDSVQSHCASLMKTARSDKSRKRVSDIDKKAEALK